MTNRSEAASKAWATRRSRAASTKRSASAKKAWETRRADKPEPVAETIDPRSLAAHKAWATRRANGWVHPASRV